ncbi:MAG: SpoIIE family protein phosphatase [Planctomycetes bacterium]|nr:SpoIIE family protein phosphatase [Planctomycetota bacterium]
MSIRWKLLILLLVMVLVPLMVVSLVNGNATRRLGNDLARQSREAVTDLTRSQLLQAVEDYATILQRERDAMELTIKTQAREVERFLAEPPPPVGRVYWAEDYDRGGAAAPADLKETEMHFREREGGTPEPITVSIEEQVLLCPTGVDRDAHREDVARLARMLPTFRFLYEARKESIIWQYASLASGLHASYPGHGGYPADYDPRRRPWYETATSREGVTWNPPSVDAPTNRIVVTASMPVHHPDGSIAGATAIDLTLSDLLAVVKLPATWSPDAESLLVRLKLREKLGSSGGDAPAGVVDGPPLPALLGAEIIAQQGYHETSRQWDMAIKLEWLESSDRPAFEKMIRDMEVRKSGVRKMPYNDRDSLWAYASAYEGGGFLVLIVPYDDIVAHAIALEQTVLDRTELQMRTMGIIALAVVFIVVAIAFVSSRTVTRPLRRLAWAAKRIAHGQLDAKVPVFSRDEIGALGHTFNTMIPKLREHMNVKQSLALAMEVQQNLLPTTAPEVDGLDIAGASDYCDETGGDYYDFFDVSKVAPHGFVVVVGDVTGHGIAAALLMTTARALLRAQLDHAGDLARVVGTVNRHLSNDITSGQFMTFFYMLFDTKLRTARWVTAGHDPAITYDPSTDTFAELGGSDIPLGVEADWRYSAHGPTTLADGLVILIGTDGVWETRNPAGEAFGKDALRALIRTHAGKSAAEITRAVKDALIEYRGGRSREDDVTVVTIVCRP